MLFSWYMPRVLVLVVLVAAGTFLALPFVTTSRALTEHGIAIRGTVYHKSESVKVRYSSWDLVRDITIEYTIPETSSAGFFDVHPDSQQYDSMRTGQSVEVRYLPRKDVPAVPGAKLLWELHALPTVRLANLRGVSRLDTLVMTPLVVLASEIAGGIILLLILWRITRWRPFGWAAAIGVLPLLAFILMQGFPRPTPEPAGEVRQAVGRVTNIGRIDKLFSGSRSRGLPADQPVDVVSVEFVAEGKAEAVVAVDLIDRGSFPGLKERASVSVRYELSSPRTAYIEGATRRFPERNFSGIIVVGILYLAVAMVMLGAVYLLGRVYRRQTRSSRL